MSALTLRLKAAPPGRIDMSPIVPARLRELAIADVVRLPLACGDERVQVGELFEVTAGDAAQIVIEGGHERLDNVGAALDAGSVVVEGDAGVCCGRGMRGGRVHVTGSVGPWPGAQMRGGVLEIGGDAGDCIGGALPGDTRGMNGGILIVRGNAGANAGDRMRRGMIAIAGDAGAYAGSRMIAGSILVLGSAAPYVGCGMRRGTVLLRQAPARWLPTFADAGAHELTFLRVLARWFPADEPLGRTLAELGPRVRRHIGDAAAGGKGEILVW